MTSRLHIALATTALALMFSANTVTARAQQKLVTADRAQTVDTVSTIFTAARTDVAKFDSVIASDFYIYDAGARFNGGGVMNLIKTLHAEGERFEWNVTEPDVHITGNMAWIAYVNKGSVTDASGTAKQNWLESAFLRKQAGIGKVVLMQSHRVPMATQGQMTSNL